MALQIVNSQRDNDELKYYEDIYHTDDSIIIDGKQLPSFTIVENTYYSGESDEEYRVNARIACQLGNAEGMKQFISATDKILNPMIFKGNTLWTYERIAAFPTVASCKEYIENYINEDVTKQIFSKQKEIE
jgi:hypothetical protein|tara:strand:- start:2467 stop:2859 length:393 start_codon:yes stop_codon:yes gene_type:complete